MKRLGIIFITGFAFISIGLICLLIYSISHGPGTIFTTAGLSSAKLVNTQTISLDGINSIDILYRSDNIDFYISDTDELILKEYKSYTPDDDELAVITKSNNEISIKCETRNYRLFNFGMISSRVEIFLPIKYSNKLSAETSSGNISSDLTFNLSEFTVESTSGNIRVNEVYAEHIKAKASSGNISFNVAEGDREFSATSGNIKVYGGQGDGEFSTSSGNITVEKASGFFDAEASSGNIKVIDSVGGGDINTTSGNITLGLETMTQDIKVNASSGEVRLTLPDTASFEFTSQTSSGAIRTFFDTMLSFNKKGNRASGTIGDSPEIDVNIETTSGNIRVSD